MSRRKVSLSAELHLVSRALDAAELLTRQWRDSHFNQEEFPRLAHALHATMILVRERLVLVECSIRDTLDPRHISHAENQAFDQLPGDDEGDVVLRCWSTRKTAAKLKQEAERAAHRLKILAQRRKREEDER